MKQRTFADLAYDNKKKVTRKERFLSEMDTIIPWGLLLSCIDKARVSSPRGRSLTPNEVLLRCYFMQQWYGLSDPAMEDSLYDVESMRRFAGVSLNNIPDESSIQRFRQVLEKHSLTEELFALTNEYLTDKGLLLKAGTIVDATIISAPRSTKNKAQKSSPEMRSTRKGNNWHYGMKMHVGTDLQGRVHHVKVTDASVHDSKVMDDLLHGEEQSIYGDKAYANEAKAAKAKLDGVNWRVSRKAKRNCKLNCADKSFNRKSNRTRSKVEHVFGVVKNLWGYRKVRYRGLYKNTCQTFTLMALANLYLCRRELSA